MKKEDEDLSISLGQYADALAKVGTAATNRHFMAEYDGHTLYAGGEGCFSLQTTLKPDQLRKLGQAVLDLLGVSHHIEQDEFQVALVGGKLEVYQAVVLEKGTRNDTRQILEGFAAECQKAARKARRDD